MWARTRFDIGYSDLSYGLRQCGLSRDREALARGLEERWTPGGDALACFSVRTGLDLVLRSLDLPEKSEILFSAMNVRGMVKLTRRLGLVPVPIDLEIDTMGPSLASMERAISRSTKAVVVAPLFGARFDLGPIIRLARQHGLRVIEDCAQAFSGERFKGHPDADVSMFSFGPLKFATALGGALLRVRDPRLLRRMRALEATYPVQPTKEYATRLMKFGGLSLLTKRPVLGAVGSFFRARGRDYEDAVTDAVRGVAKLGSAKRLRKRCSPALLALMTRRIARFRDADLEPRRRVGRKLIGLLGGVLTLPGAANPDHNFWVFPVIVDNPGPLMFGLRERGFDAATLRRSATVEPPADRPELRPEVARTALARLVVLPCYPGMSDAEIDRQARCVRGLIAAEPDETHRAAHVLA